MRAWGNAGFCSSSSNKWITSDEEGISDLSNAAQIDQVNALSFSAFCTYVKLLRSCKCLPSSEKWIASTEEGISPLFDDAQIDIEMH